LNNQKVIINKEQREEKTFEVSSWLDCAETQDDSQSVRTRFAQFRKFYKPVKKVGTNRTHTAGCLKKHDDFHLKQMIFNYCR
jgi:hypothetical protein